MQYTKIIYTLGNKLNYCLFVLVFIAFNNVSAQSPESVKSSDIFKSIKVCYWDSVSDPKSMQYRELITVGKDNGYFSKPSKIDISVILEPIKSGTVQIQMEELFDRNDELLIKDSYKGSISTEKKWVINKVVLSEIAEPNLRKTAVSKDIDYKTAYFLSSRLFPKRAFRVVAIYYPNEGSEIDFIYKEFYFY